MPIASLHHRVPLLTESSMNHCSSNSHKFDSASETTLSFQNMSCAGPMSGQGALASLPKLSRLIAWELLKSSETAKVIRNLCKHLRHHHQHLHGPRHHHHHDQHHHPSDHRQHHQHHRHSRHFLALLHVHTHGNVICFCPGSHPYHHQQQHHHHHPILTVILSVIY